MVCEVGGQVADACPGDDGGQGSGGGGGDGGPAGDLVVFFAVEHGQVEGVEQLLLDPALAFRNRNPSLPNQSLCVRCVDPSRTARDP